MGLYDMHGGVFTPLGYTRINTGGSHDENPNGGVQIGVDPQGIPNMVEENESIYKDYVYSDNINADGGILEKHSLPKKYAGKLYSEIADAILADVGDMTTDEIALRGMNVHLARLAEAQEEQKQIEEQKALEEELANLSPEELVELEVMLAQEEGSQEIEQPAVTPMMALGGPIHRFDDGGYSERAWAVASAGQKKQQDTAELNEQMRQYYADQSKYIFGRIGNAFKRNAARVAVRNAAKEVESLEAYNEFVGKDQLPQYIASLEQAYAARAKALADLEAVEAARDSILASKPLRPGETIVEFDDKPQTLVPRSQTTPSSQKPYTPFQFQFSRGGKLNTFAEGGSKRMTDEQIAAWREYMTLMNAYAGNALSGNLTPFAGKKSVKALEDSAEYRAFTQYVLDNPGDPMVNMYLRSLDEQSGAKQKLFGENGRLVKNWRQLYYNRRTDGKNGVYHYSGNAVSGLGTIGAGGYAYAPVDNGYMDTDALDPKYIESPRGGANSGTVTAPTKSGANASGTKKSKNSNTEGTTRIPDVPRLSDDIVIPESEVAIEEPLANLSSGAPLAVSPMPYRFSPLQRSARMVDPRMGILNASLVPVAPRLEDPIISDMPDIVPDDIDPRLLDDRALALEMDRQRRERDVRASLSAPFGAVVNPYATQPSSANLRSYNLSPEEESLGEYIPRYRMPSVGRPNIGYNPQSRMPFVNPFSGTNPVNLGQYNLTVGDEDFDERVPQYIPTAPVLSDDIVIPDVPLTHVGPDGNEHLIGPDPINTDYTLPEVRPISRTPRAPVLSDDISIADNTLVPDDIVFGGGDNITVPQLAARTTAANSGQSGTIPPQDNTFGLGQTFHPTTLPSWAGSGVSRASGGFDWRRYADAGRNAAMGLFNLFQSPDELNIPVAHDRFVNTPLPNFIDPIYRPTDPNLVTGDILSAGAGAARSILASGNPISAGANLAYLNGSIMGNLGRGRTQVDDANNAQLNSVIEKKNANILSRSQTMYKQALDRANYLAALDQYNINNNLAGQQYRNNALADWGRAVSEPFGAVTKFISDDYLEDRRRSLASGMSHNGYVMTQDGNWVYAPGLVDYNKK